MGFLSSADPAARVRAFDWLRSRGQAPGGYAPTADRASRRAALERFRETGETGP